MAYIYRCHLCESTFDSFEALTEHKRNELSQVAKIQDNNPEWSLRECFNYFRQANILNDEQIYAHQI
ncbi:MAG TPA: hypothetical protein VFC63_23255 [Blastocatellia bacterium]|nr:hypothetical protein [Blastocatellia bacterium]